MSDTWLNDARVRYIEFLARRGLDANQPELLDRAEQLIHQWESLSVPEPDPRPTWLAETSPDGTYSVRRRTDPLVQIEGFTSMDRADAAAAKLNTLYAALRAHPHGGTR